MYVNLGPTTDEDTRPLPFLLKGLESILKNCSAILFSRLPKIASSDVFKSVIFGPNLLVLIQ